MPIPMVRETIPLFVEKAVIHDIEASRPCASMLGRRSTHGTCGGRQVHPRSETPDLTLPKGACSGQYVPASELLRISCGPAEVSIVVTTYFHPYGAKMSFSPFLV